MVKPAVSNGDLEFVHCAAHGSDKAAEKDFESD